MIIIRRLILLITILAVHSMCTLEESQNLNEEEKKVLKIAEEEWLRIYGNDIYTKRPFVVELRDSVWVVKGTIPTNMDGGVPYAIIDTSNYEIIKIYHSK